MCRLKSLFPHLSTKLIEPSFPLLRCMQYGFHLDSAGYFYNRRLFRSILCCWYIVLLSIL